jgi:hypothetical protein
VNATDGSPADAAKARHRGGRPLHPGHRLAPAGRPDLRFHDLGAGCSDTRRNAQRAKRNPIRQLEALGDKVTLEPAA